MYFFFFKQKTAYDMRISDWSSDVCSSDLLERRIGLAAHDFVSALGAPEVLVTRARRDVSKPTIASRLWLRLEAMQGGMPRQPLLPGWAAGLDAPVGKPVPAPRHAPRPPADKRPRPLSVPSLDRRKAAPHEISPTAILKPDRRA